jgi:hypothetical protein
MLQKMENKLFADVTILFIYSERIKIKSLIDFFDIGFNRNFNGNISVLHIRPTNPQIIPLFLKEILMKITMYILLIFVSLNCQFSNADHQDIVSAFVEEINEKYPIEEKVAKLYPIWQIRNVISENIHPLYQKEYIRIIKLAKLIGYENTLQFRFLVDLGEEALPYLFLKLKEEETRFTLPVIEKMMNKKLSPEEVKQHIEKAEELLNKPEPIVTREWNDIRGVFSNIK